MNLMNDKREQERSRGFGPIEESGKPQASYQQRQGQSQKEGQYQAEYPKAKKGSPKLFFGTLFLLIAITAIIYFVFYKPRQSPITEEQGITEQRDVESETDASPGQETTQQPETVPREEMAPPSAEGTTAVQEEAPAAAQKPPATTGTQTTDAALAQINSVMSVFQNTLSDDVDLGSLIFDESTFTAEVNGNSRQAVQNYYNKIQSQLPGFASVNTLAPSSGTQALITGTVKLSTGGGQTPAADQVESRINALVNSTNVRKISLSQSAANGRTSYFLKVDGSLNDCMTFYNKVVQEGWNLKISKILLLPSTSDSNRILVMRFLV